MQVTVIGAGIVGLSVAHELASRGAAVRIVDARGPAQGATRASAGMLAPFIEGHSEALLALGVCSLNHYDTYIERVSADARQPIEYGRIGTLQVARHAGEAGHLHAAAARLAAAGAPHTMHGEVAVRALEPALAAAAAALEVPQHGYVRVGALVSALVSALEHYQVSVSADHVERIDALDADAVVVAAGSWSGDLSIEGVRIPVRPIRGQLLHLRLQRPPITRIVWGEGCYLVPWQDGSVLVGATVEDVGFNESPTAAGVRSLLEAGMELLPQLRAAMFQDVRVGLRPATVDELPVIGASSTMRRVFYATGHYRNGVLLAPLTALAIADLVLDGRERQELAPARPDRFGL